jgi:hypothetical protein
MGLFGKILLGFFVGLLCGLVPLIYGFLTNRRTSGIVGLVAATLTGVLFSLLNKSPFTAMVVSIIFILFNIANKKKESENTDEADNDLI